MTIHQLVCWCCGSNFSYQPSDMLDSRNHPSSFYQDSTVCPDCVNCMGTNACKHGAA